MGLLSEFRKKKSNQKNKAKRLESAPCFFRRFFYKANRFVNAWGISRKICRKTYSIFRLKIWHIVKYICHPLLDNGGKRDNKMNMK